jgi:LacI family transcriptional regulator
VPTARVARPRAASASRVTIVDVALAAEVSVSTVSKVINDRYGVSPETYDKVMDVVAELGYESSLVASSLRRTSTNVLGILVPEFEPFSTELLKGISSAAEGTGYELLAYSGNLEHNHVGWERRSLSRLAGTLIDGAVIVAPHRGRHQRHHPRGRHRSAHRKLGREHDRGGQHRRRS